MQPRHKYMIEVERPDRTYAMVLAIGEDAEIAKAAAICKLGGLSGTIVACAAKAPEFGTTCKRELVE